MLYNDLLLQPKEVIIMFKINGDVNGVNVSLTFEASSDYEARKEFRESFDRQDNVVILSSEKVEG